MSRHDPVPEGLSAQLDYFQGGDGYCGDPSEALTIDVLTPPDQEFLSTPDTYAVCINGYSLDGDVVVIIQDPAGRVIETMTFGQRRLEGFNGFVFRRLGSDLEGIYTFTASQGGQVVNTTLEVRAAKAPQYILLYDYNGEPGDGRGAIAQPGSTVRAAVGGFTPNSKVYLHIYNNPHASDESEGAVVDYLTSHPVIVNSTGSGIWELPTVESDPEGCYVLHSELVTRLLYPARSEPSISIPWHASFCLFKNPIN